jgi:hypothetical protein
MRGTQRGGVGVGDLLGQHSIQHHARSRPRARALQRGSRTPAPLPLNALGDGIGPAQGASLVADAWQFGLAAQTLVNQPGDPGPVPLGDGRVSQRDDHTVAGLALGVAIGLQ